MSRFVIAMLMWSAVAASADEATPAPKSPSARAAVEKAEKALAAAEAAHRKAQADARRQLLSDLEASKREAMKNENLSEANAIEALIKRTREELARTPAPGAPPAVAVVTGTWDVTFSDGGKARYRIGPRTVDNTGWKVEYERNDNELRFRTPADESVRLVFSGDRFTLESWRSSPRPFKGEPTFTGEGKRAK